MKSAAQDLMQADEDPVASQAPLLAFLAVLAVVDAWLTNLPEPTPQMCMITAGTQYSVTMTQKHPDSDPCAVYLTTEKRNTDRHGSIQPG